VCPGVNKMLSDRQSGLLIPLCAIDGLDIDGRRVARGFEEFLAAHPPPLVGVLVTEVTFLSPNTVV
jgi:hypothetical protein